jgi:hypothetical protein
LLLLLLNCLLLLDRRLLFSFDLLLQLRLLPLGCKPLHALLLALVLAWLQHLRGARCKVGHVPGGSCSLATRLTATLANISTSATACCCVCRRLIIISFCCCFRCCYCWLTPIAIIDEAVSAAIIS